MPGKNLKSSIIKTTLEDNTTDQYMILMQQCGASVLHNGAESPSFLRASSKARDMENSACYVSHGTQFSHGIRLSRAQAVWGQFENLWIGS